MRLNKILFFLFLLLVACKQKHEFSNSSFYYWKTVYDLNGYEQEFLEEVNTKKIYFKVFDVMHESPMGVLLWGDSVDQSVEYIPVVFIDNDIFRNKTQQANIELAKNIFRLLKGVCKRQKIEINEIQIDCDWTQGTKENYFFFLKELKKIANCTLSTTIRLHQIKFKNNTGVPPCDYGVLMCYNMGNLKSSGAKNSIYDADILKQYLKGASYKLPLKVALPIFNWMLLYRDSKFTGILNRDVYQKTISSIGEKVTKGYRIKKDTFIFKRSFAKDDYIRDEKISSKDLKEMQEYLSQTNLNFSPEIIYFSLDSTNISQYEKSVFTF